MTIVVRVSPGAKRSEVIELAPGEYRIKVDAKAVDGKANIRLFQIIAEHFKVPFSAIRLVSGATSRQKVIEIETG